MPFAHGGGRPDSRDRPKPIVPRDHVVAGSSYRYAEGEEPECSLSDLGKYIVEGSIGSKRCYFFSGWEGVDFPLPAGRAANDADLQIDIRRRYAAMLENIDTWLGKMTDTLVRRGMLNNTIILFASDHGEMLGDRNMWKKQVPYEPSVRVPLIWSGPGIRPCGLDQSPGSLVDISATLLSFAGAAPLTVSDSLDLTEYLAGRAAYPRRYSHSGLGEWRAITDGRWKLVLGYRTDLPLSKMQFGAIRPLDSSKGRLFDLWGDPGELSNLWEFNREIRERMLSALLQEAQRSSTAT